MADQGSPKKIADRYLKGEFLGEGTYGVVYKAIDTHTSQTVAIKKIRSRKKKDAVNITAPREIKLLKELKDQNIIELIDTLVHKGKLHLVLEFMETDLDAVINDPNIILSPADTKSYVQMMLKGLAYCHKKWVLHRDIKPNNLLIGPNGDLKLGDFGLARIFGCPDQSFTNQVFSRWYRAPELLFGATHYGPGVDVWASACIFAELLLGRPFLQGTSDFDQLGKIFLAFGTPILSQWPDIAYLPDYVEYKYFPAPPLRSLFSMASDDALDLLSKMFTFNPNTRISAQEALEHRYFTSEPLPTVPHKLPKPAQKGEFVVSGDGPTVFSLSRKSSKVVPPCDGFEENSLPEGNTNGNFGDNTSNTESDPISIDFSISGLQPPNSSTNNR